MTDLDLTKLYERDDLTITEILDLIERAGIPGFSWDIVQRERKAHRALLGLKPIKRGPKPQPGPTSPIVAAQPATVPGQAELTVILKLDDDQFNAIMDVLGRISRG